MSNRKRHQMQRRKDDIEYLPQGSAPICKACDRQLEFVGDITLMLADGFVTVDCFECPLCGRGYVIPRAALQVDVRPAF